MRLWWLGSILGAMLLPRLTSAAEPQIDAAFPGGNIVLERIEGDDVYLHQDLRDTAGFWFYWSFRVRGAAGRTLTFHFTQGNVLAARGPAVSTDGGHTWAWLGRAAVQDATFRYRFAADAGDVRFCMGMPYLEANLREFLARHAGSPALKTATLATSQKGRPVERLHLGRLVEPEYRVLLTARHHACEMMAGWVLDGFCDAVLADDDLGRWYRGHVEVLAVPFVDKDGVEDGDQGKNRRPHDHNRDYLGQSIYPSVAALREFVPGWSQGRLRVALDLHCPNIRPGKPGGRDEQIFFVGQPDPRQWEQAQAISAILKRVQRGPLVFDPANNIPFGREWNTLPEPRMCARWAAQLPGVRFAATLEVAYAEAGGQEVTIDTARTFGHDLAAALREYLQAGAK